MQLVKMPGETWAYVTRPSGFDGKQLNEAIQDAFEDLTERIVRAGVRAHGQPRARFRYRNCGQAGFDIGFPIDASDETRARAAGLCTGVTVSGDAMIHIHRGPYARLGDSYRQMQQEFSKKGLKAGEDVWEFYLNDPDHCQPKDLLTQIVWPIEQVRTPEFA